MKITLDDAKALAQKTATDVWGPRDPISVIKKLHEESEELEEAIEEYNLETTDALSKKLAKLNIEKELGDCLFRTVRLADNLDIDCETALKLTIVKIQERAKFGLTHDNNV